MIANVHGLPKKIVPGVVTKGHWSVPFVNAMKVIMEKFVSAKKLLQLIPETPFYHA